MKIAKSFRAARWIRTTNLVLQAILFATLFGGLNYLAIHHPWRIDLTHLRSQTLSPETISYLHKLNQPVKIIVTLRKLAEDDDSQPAQAYRDLTALLREYAYATEGNPAGRVTFECIDIYQQSNEAREYDLPEAGPTLVLCGDKRHVVDFSELYQFEKTEKVAFLGEQAITAAILDVSSPKKKKIFFLTGHGELDPNSTSENTGLATLASQLRLRNFEVERLDLAARGRIPEDASLIVSAISSDRNRMTRYSHAEEELLRQYLSNSTSEHPGRLLIFIPPGLPKNPQLEATGLENLLFDWGIMADDVLVCDSNPNNISETKDLIIDFFDNKHPISKLFDEFNLKISFGSSRSVRVHPMRATDESLAITRLAGTHSQTAWGERNYTTVPYRYGDNDLEWRAIGFAVASEPAKDKKLSYNVQAGRVVAFGSSDFIANNRLGKDGNLHFVLSSVNWLTGGGGDLTVRPRPIQKYQLTLNQSELDRLRYSLLGILPAVAGLLGLIVYWTRRS